MCVLLAPCQRFLFKASWIPYQFYVSRLKLLRRDVHKNGFQRSAEVLCAFLSPNATVEFVRGVIVMSSGTAYPTDAIPKLWASASFAAIMAVSFLRLCKEGGVTNDAAYGGFRLLSRCINSSNFIKQGCHACTLARHGPHFSCSCLPVHACRPLLVGHEVYI